MQSAAESSTWRPPPPLARCLGDARHAVWPVVAPGHDVLIPAAPAAEPRPHALADLEGRRPPPALLRAPRPLRAAAAAARRVLEFPHRVVVGQSHVPFDIDLLTARPYADDAAAAFRVLGRADDAAHDAPRPSARALQKILVPLHPLAIRPHAVADGERAGRWRRPRQRRHLLLGGRRLSLAHLRHLERRRRLQLAHAEVVGEAESQVTSTGRSHADDAAARLRASGGPTTLSPPTGHRFGAFKTF